MNSHDKHLAQDQFKQPGNVSTFALQNQNALQIFFIHVYAVLYKRFWWSIRDFKALICSLFCPVVLSGMALGLLTITIASNQPEIQLSSTPTFNDNPNHILIHCTDDINDNNDFPPNSYIISDNFYSSNNTLYDTYINYLQDLNGEMLLTELNISVNKYLDWTPRNASECQEYEQVGPRGRFQCTKTAQFPYPFYTNISHSFQDHLLDLPSDEYISFLFFPYSMTRNNQKRVYFGVNGSAYHSLPIIINLWNNWIWNDIMGDDVTDETQLEIVATMHPLPVATRQDLISGQLTGFFAALYLVIGNETVLLQSAMFALVSSGLALLFSFGTLILRLTDPLDDISFCIILKLNANENIKSIQKHLGYRLKIRKYIAQSLEIGQDLIKVDQITIGVNKLLIYISITSPVVHKKEKKNKFLIRRTDTILKKMKSEFNSEIDEENVDYWLTKLLNAKSNGSLANNLKQCIKLQYIPTVDNVCHDDANNLMQYLNYYLQ